MQKNQNNQMLIPKIMDKIRFSKNKIINTEFLNEYQISIIDKELRRNKEKNYFFEGGYTNAESKILIAYPEREDEDVIKQSIYTILKAIKVELPNEVHGKFEHRDYLGTLMSFGLSRERIGDIIVYKDCAYIIVLEENAEYIKNSLSLEKRFKKAEISIINIDEVKPKQIEFENIKISVNSTRLDSFVSELLNTSRRLAQELIDLEKVSINYSVETKYTKSIKEKDILIIRGSGKYIIEEFIGKNKRDKEIIKIKKYK